MTIPPWRRDRPVGKVDGKGNVLLSSEFWRQFEAVTAVVNDSDGSSPGGVDAVAFASYPQTAGSAPSVATYSAQDSVAVAASYSQAESQSVSASYAPACGGVTLARY